MSAALLCQRCKAENPSIAGEIPLPADLEDLVRRHICSSCWKEWQEMEIMVINELKLNFMDPAAQDVLVGRMKEFFELAPGQ